MPRVATPLEVLPSRLALASHFVGALRRRIKTAKTARITESIDPRVYSMPRNLDIFPKSLGSIAASKQAIEAPIQYTLSQLKSIFERAHRDEDHIENIYVSTAMYCKQTNDAQHEFLLLKVFDSKIPEISNFLVLDRTVQSSASPGVAALSSSTSSDTPAHDRIRVSCYGDKDTLTEQCGLRSYEVLERLDFPLSTSSRPLLLCDLVILAFETSECRKMYNLTSAQCYWFAGSIWECMQALCPTARRIPIEKVNNRGKFRKLSWQKVERTEVTDILYKAETEISRFRVQLSRSKEAAGRNRINITQQVLEEHRRNIEELKKEIEVLKLPREDMNLFERFAQPV